MPNKQRNQHKKQQRALQKRTKRRQKQARKQQSQTQENINPRRLLRMARQMPIEGAWVQQGWQDQGIARVTLARSQPNDNILFGEYMVDYLCAGVRDTSYASNLDRDTFFNELIPRIYSGNPPLAIEESLAHEIIWGAVEYAAGLGLEPHRNFRESSRILEPSEKHTHSHGVAFGHHQGRPVYIPYSGDNQVGIIRRLIETAGLGNFYYLPQGDVPEDVAELLQQEQPDEASGPDIWRPDSQTAGSVNTQSGLWIPGQESEPAPEGEEPEQPLIWTPGSRA